MLERSRKYYLKQNQRMPESYIQYLPFCKMEILRTENIDQRSKVVPIANGSIAETFGSDIGVLHVTYVEPKITNLS